MGPRSSLYKILFTAIPYILVFCAWHYYSVINPIGFWEMRGDYHWYSLSQAFTLEAKFAGFPASNHGYGGHPGVPFGFASWLALRLAAWGINDPAAIIAYGVDHAERYWTFAKIVALALNLAGILILQRMFKGRLSLFLFAALIYFAATPAVFFASLNSLTNETFAIVLIPSSYLLIYRLLAPELDSGSKSSEKRAVFFFGRRDAISVAIGILTAVGWSIKIYYTAPAFGLAVGLVAAAAMRTMNVRTILRCIVYLGVGFLATVTLIVYFVIGWEKFAKLITWNLTMLSHINRYGSGEQGFLQSENVVDALQSITLSTNGTLPAIIVAVAAIAIITFLVHRKDKIFIRRNLPFVFCITVGILINFTGLLKHYAPHYALVLCASLPCVLLILANEKFPRPLVGITSVLMLSALALNLYGYSLGHDSDVRRASAIQRDLEIVENLPISPGQKRVWGYFSPAKAGVVPLIAQYAGSPFVARAIYGNATVVDIVPTSDLLARDWKYVLFPKSFFSTRESVALEYRKRFDFALTEFEIEPTDRLDELETWFLLTRQSGVGEAPH